MNKTIIQRLCLLYLATVFCVAIQAQTVKNITVSQKASYTDHISLQEDSRDMDLMVKFIFDEQANTLTVSLLSYRSLFVFREDTRYSQAMKGRCLIPENLPYVVETVPDGKFRLSRALKKSVPKPRKKYVFKRWIEYAGLQPAPMEYKIVNDYIEQVFDVLNKRSFVTITLRDLFVMEHKGTSARTLNNYELFFRKDLNTRYQIEIQRDPCTGLEDELLAAQKACASIEKGYSTIKNRYEGKTISKTSLPVFEELKDILIKQYPPKEVESPCPDVQETWEIYNSYIDSVKLMKVNVMDDGGKAAAPSVPIDEKVVLSQARIIDKSVSRWLLTSDALERRDLEKRCQDIIKDVTAMINSGSATTEIQKKAVQIFRNAERYFLSTCKKEGQ